MQKPFAPVDDPDSYAQTQFDADDGPMVAGDGDINYVCHNCGELLMEGLTKTITINGLVVECSACDEYNLVRVL